MMRARGRGARDQGVSGSECAGIVKRRVFCFQTGLGWCLVRRGSDGEGTCQGARDLLSTDLHLTSTLHLQPVHGLLAKFKGYFACAWHVCTYVQTYVRVYIHFACAWNIYLCVGYIYIHTYVQTYIHTIHPHNDPLTHFLSMCVSGVVGMGGNGRKL